MRIATLVILFASLPAMAAENIAPWPRSAKFEGGTLTLVKDARIAVADESLLPLAKILSEEIRAVTGIHPAVSRDAARPGDISLALQAGLPNDDYRLAIADRALITGGNYNAVALGSVTVLQLLGREGNAFTLLKGTVDDGPAFKFECYLLNTAYRHYPMEELKQYIRYCRLNKCRFFLMTLSSDNGWLFPSKAYPLLGEKNWSWAGAPKPTVYTMDELKDLVAYADARGVTIVPQIQTLGHSDSMRLSYPDIFDLPEKPGGRARMAMVNMTSEKAYEAFDTLVGEICDVFKSSPYFHIGCDEVNYGVLNKQPSVQQYLKDHNLPDIGHLAVIHYNRLNAMIKKRGKRTIVWEPLLNAGPLDKDIIPEPWVGGAASAEKWVAMGYDIVSAPWGTKKAYHDVYNVNGSQLQHGDPHLIGAMALNWATTDAMPTGSLMFLEPVWNPEANRGTEDFLTRAQALAATDDKLQVGFAIVADGCVPVTTFNNLSPVFSDQATLRLDCPAGGVVRYTLDGSAVTETSSEFTKPITLSQTTTLRARRYADGVAGPAFERVYKRYPRFEHDGMGAKVTIDPPDPSYYNAGPKTLADGFIAETDSCSEACMLGWTVSPTITLELPAAKEIRSVYVKTVVGAGGLALPKTLQIQLSDDGKTWDTVGSFEGAKEVAGRGWLGLTLPAPRTSRYVRVIAEIGGDWLFIDEVVLNRLPPPPDFRHAAVGKPVTVVNPPENHQPPTPPVSCLADGYVTPLADWTNLQWLGFKKDLDATIDLGEVTDIREVGGNFMHDRWQRIALPAEVRVEVSDDGKAFRPVGHVDVPTSDTRTVLRTVAVSVNDVRARYVRLIAPVKDRPIYVNEIFVNRESK